MAKKGQKKKKRSGGKKIIRTQKKAKEKKKKKKKSIDPEQDFLDGGAILVGAGSLKPLLPSNFNMKLTKYLLANSFFQTISTADMKLTISLFRNAWVPKRENFHEFFLLFIFQCSRSGHRS
jgi:hypothetical protein